MRALDILAVMAIASCTTSTRPTAPPATPKEEPHNEDCNPPDCYPDPRPPHPLKETA